MGSQTTNVLWNGENGLSLDNLVVKTKINNKHYYLTGVVFGLGNRSADSIVFEPSPDSFRRYSVTVDLNSGLGPNHPFFQMIKNSSGENTRLAFVTDLWVKDTITGRSNDNSLEHSSAPHGAIAEIDEVNNATSINVDEDIYLLDEITQEQSENYPKAKKSLEFETESMKLEDLLVNGKYLHQTNIVDNSQPGGYKWEELEVDYNEFGDDGYDVIVMDFCAAHCLPCRVNKETILRLQSRFFGTNVKFINIIVNNWEAYMPDPTDFPLNSDQTSNWFDVENTFSVTKQYVSEDNMCFSSLMVDKNIQLDSTTPKRNYWEKLFNITSAPYYVLLKVKTDENGVKTVTHLRNYETKFLPKMESYISSLVRPGLSPNNNLQLNTDNVSLVDGKYEGSVEINRVLPQWVTQNTYGRNNLFKSSSISTNIITDYIQDCVRLPPFYLLETYPQVTPGKPIGAETMNALRNHKNGSGLYTLDANGDIIPEYKVVIQDTLETKYELLATEIEDLINNGGDLNNYPSGNPLEIPIPTTWSVDNNTYPTRSFFDYNDYTVKRYYIIGTDVQPQSTFTNKYFTIEQFNTLIENNDVTQYYSVTKAEDLVKTIRDDYDVRDVSKFVYLDENGNKQNLTDESSINQWWQPFNVVENNNLFYIETNFQQLQINKTDAPIDIRNNDFFDTLCKTSTCCCCPTVCCDQGEGNNNECLQWSCLSVVLNAYIFYIARKNLVDGNNQEVKVGNWVSNYEHLKLNNPHMEFVFSEFDSNKLIDVFPKISLTVIGTLKDDIDFNLNEYKIGNNYINNKASISVDGPYYVGLAQNVKYMSNYITIPNFADNNGNIYNNDKLGSPPLISLTLEENPDSTATSLSNALNINPDSLYVKPTSSGIYGGYIGFGTGYKAQYLPDAFQLKQLAALNRVESMYKLIIGGVNEFVNFNSQVMYPHSNELLFSRNFTVELGGSKGNIPLIVAYDVSEQTVDYSMLQYLLIQDNTGVYHTVKSWQSDGRTADIVEAIRTNEIKLLYIEDKFTDDSIEKDIKEFLSSNSVEVLLSGINSGQYSVTSTHEVKSDNFVITEQEP